MTNSFTITQRAYDRIDGFASDGWRGNVQKTATGTWEVSIFNPDGDQRMDAQEAKRDDALAHLCLILSRDGKAA